MAVDINVQGFRDSLPAGVCQTAAALRGSGKVGQVELAGGGAQAVVRDGGAAYQPWVGVVGREFVAECECPTGAGWCEHAVAVALTALECDIRWSGDATPPSVEPVPAEHVRYLEAVARLAPRQLTALVADQAGADRLFATRLLAAAGMLTGPDEAALERFDETVRAAAGVTGGRNWEIRDVEIAGQHLVDETAILRAYPASLDVLDRVEEALVVWDELAGILIEAYYLRTTDPEEISVPLVEAHAAICEQLDLLPEEVERRLGVLLERCHHDTVDTDAYAHLIDNGS